MGSDLEWAQEMLSNDPDYEEWSNGISGHTVNDSKEAESTEGAEEQLRELQLSELRGHSGGCETPPF